MADMDRRPDPMMPALRMQIAVDAFVSEARAAFAEATAYQPDANEARIGLGGTVSIYREIQGLTLQEVADRAGCTKSHVWEIEQGRSRNPTVKMVAGLAAALGLPFMMLASAALHDVSAAPATPADGRGE